MSIRDAEGSHLIASESKTDNTLAEEICLFGMYTDPKTRSATGVSVLVFWYLRPLIQPIS